MQRSSYLPRTYRVGELKHRLRIQRQTTESDGAGGQTLAYVDVATVWGQVVPGQGREFYLAKQLDPSLTHVVTIRFRAGVDSSMRFVYDKRVFQIVGPPVDTGFTHIELVCNCREVVTNA